MNVLLLDDTEIRHSTVERLLSDAGHRVLHTYTPEECITVLKAGSMRVGLLLLDNDLGDVGEGNEVASYILRELDVARFPARCIVISHNPSAALNAASKLTTAGIDTTVEKYSEELVKRLVLELQIQ